MSATLTLVLHQPQESVVAIFERALADAKAGKLSTIAIVGLYEDGILQANANVESHIYRMIGAIEALKLELWEKHVERS